MKKAIINTLTIAFLLSISTITKGQNTTSVAPKQNSTTVAPKKSPTTVKPQQKPATSIPKKTTTPADKTKVDKKQIPNTTTTKPATAQAPIPNYNTLAGQYEDMTRHSWMQQGYQVLNPNRLKAFWRSVQDSLKAERKSTAPLKNKIAAQAKTIADLKAQVSTGEQNLEESQSSVNEVSFLGMRVDKSTYNTIMWGAVITLAAALLIVLFTAGKSIREAKYRRQLYDEVSAEYQAYKVKANDKEKKLARELQTERNRVEELLEKNK